MMCWFDEKPLTLGGKYILRHTSNEALAMVKDVVYNLSAFGGMDINHLAELKMIKM